MKCGNDTVSELDVPLSEASTRTKQRHILQSSEAVAAVLRTIAGDEAGELWGLVKKSKLVDDALGCQSDEILDALIDSYRNVANKDTKIQILSMIIDKVKGPEIKKLLPEVKDYELRLAKHPAATYGKGEQRTEKTIHLSYINTSQLDHFITFITSSHIMQDLPYGETVLKLHSGEEIRIPQPIRMMIPQRIVNLYLHYCTEVGFKAMSRSTLLKILSECSASLRKSLQGLDNFAAAGRCPKILEYMLFLLFNLLCLSLLVSYIVLFL